MSSDGYLCKNLREGKGISTRFKVNLYNCKAPAAVVGTLAIEFQRNTKGPSEILAYGLFDNDYNKLINDETMDCSIVVISKEVYRTLEFCSPVRWA